jgi:hypothetical protein
MDAEAWHRLIDEDRDVLITRAAMGEMVAYHQSYHADLLRKKLSSRVEKPYNYYELGFSNDEDHEIITLALNHELQKPYAIERCSIRTLAFYCECFLLSFKIAFQPLQK